MLPACVEAEVLHMPFPLPFSLTLGIRLVVFASEAPNLPNIEVEGCANTSKISLQNQNRETRQQGGSGEERVGGREEGRKVCVSVPGETGNELFCFRGVACAWTLVASSWCLFLPSSSSFLSSLLSEEKEHTPCESRSVVKNEKKIATWTHIKKGTNNLALEKKTGKSKREKKGCADTTLTSRAG